MKNTPITVARGDGIGPEIMDATLHILQAAGAALDLEFIEVGEAVYQRGHSAGIEPAAWESLRRTRVFLKAPITTPQGGGFKSLNVTIRKTLGLYANVRPCVAYAPFVDTKHPGMNLVIVRENEEDLYAGIEHRQTDEVFQCLKLISVPGTEKIVRYAFEYARAYGRKKVSCFTKDNIMKHTDGLFHQIFDDIGAEYPELEREHWIVDIGAAKLADTPNVFDVIVMPNLYGDILSDVAAQIAGSVGLAGSANVGELGAMFEAIHGSAPRRANQDLANPSGLLLGAVQMLAHINQQDVAARVHNAWLRTLEDGIHTYDIYKEGISRQKVGTKAFAQAIADRLGQQPEQLPVAQYGANKTLNLKTYQPKPSAKKETVGVDIFLNEANRDATRIATLLKTATGEDFELLMITNRGVKVWPDGLPETFCTDHWRCRFMATSGPLNNRQIADLITRISATELDFIKCETLRNFDGERGYSLGQGQ